MDQYSLNIKKRVIGAKPKFKKGDIVRYFLREDRFSKEATLSGSWSRSMYKIHQINMAHKFNPMHTYILFELGKDSPVRNLPVIQENLLKLARHNERYLFYVEKILKRKRTKFS